jgi:hypothetical protein
LLLDMLGPSGSFSLGFIDKGDSHGTPASSPFFFGRVQAHRFPTFQARQAELTHANSSADWNGFGKHHKPRD